MHLTSTANTITILNGTEYTAGECEWEDVGLKKIDDYTVELTTAAPVTADEIMTHLCFTTARWPWFTSRPMKLP